MNVAVTMDELSKVREQVSQSEALLRKEVSVVGTRGSCL